MKLILGSSSKYRKKLMEEGGYVFDILAPELDEKAIETPNPFERPLILARAKGDELVKKYLSDSRGKEPVLIITSDIVIVGNRKLFEKPEHELEARDFLRQYQEGLIPETICAVVITNTETGERFEGVDVAKVYFKKFPEEMIEEWIKSGHAFNCAGGFGISHDIFAPYVDKVEGEREGVIGLPMKLLGDLLTRAGYVN